MGFNVCMTATQVDVKLGGALDEIKLKSLKPMTAEMFEGLSCFEKIDEDLLVKMGQPCTVLCVR